MMQGARGRGKTGIGKGKKSDRDELVKEVQEKLETYGIEYGEKWKTRSWYYRGDLFFADVPMDIVELFDEAITYMNDLGEYCCNIAKEDYIVVFVYENKTPDEILCYFIINVIKMELTMIQDHDNHDISAKYYGIANEYCKGVGLLCSLPL